MWSGLDNATVCASSVNSYKRHTSQGWIFCKTTTVSVIFEAEPGEASSSKILEVVVNDRVVQNKQIPGSSLRFCTWYNSG